jgi:hypothetical protein
MSRLNDVAELVRRFDLTSLQPLVRACESLAGEPTAVDVAVLGQFKSGKSSLLNAVVCKLLCHNLCCLIQEQEELGIVPVFWDGDKPRLPVRPAKV